VRPSNLCVTLWVPLSFVFNNLARKLPGYVCHLIGSSEADDSEKVSHFILATCGPGFHVAQVVLQTWGFSGKGPNTLIPTNRDELHNGKPPIGTCPRIGRRGLALPRCASRHPERSRSPADRQESSSSLAARIHSIVKEQHAPGQRERTRTLPPRRTSLVTNRLANFRARVYWPFGQRSCYLYLSNGAQVRRGGIAQRFSSSHADSETPSIVPPGLQALTALFPALRCASCQANYNRRSAAKHRRRTVRSSTGLSHRL